MPRPTQGKASKGTPVPKRKRENSATQIEPAKLDEFFNLLVDALKRANKTQADLAGALFVDPSLLSRYISRQLGPPLPQFARQFVEKIAPFLVAYGGITDAQQVIYLAGLLGRTVSISELEAIADIIRNKYPLQADEDREFVLGRERDFRLSIANVSPKPASLIAADGPDYEKVLERLSYYVWKTCSYAPLACGQRLPITNTIQRIIDLKPIVGDPVQPGSVKEVTALSRMSGLLVGVPGSGRTTFLMRLASAWAVNWAADLPLAIYVRAPELLHYIGSRQTIFHFLARQLLPQGQSSRKELAELVKAVQALDENQQLLWLVDDLDRLPQSRRAELASHFVGSPVVYAVAPWEEDAFRTLLLPAQHLGAYILRDLTSDEQRQMLIQLTRENPNRSCSLDEAMRAAEEVPELVKLPMGVAALYAQCLESELQGALIAERAAREYCTRAGIDWPGQLSPWRTIHPAIRGLIELAELHMVDLLFYGCSAEVLAIPRARFAYSAGQEFQSDWDALPETRLCEPFMFGNAQDTGLRFFSDDLLCFFACCRRFYNLPRHVDVDCLLPRPLRLFRQADKLRTTLKAMPGYDIAA